MKDKPRMDQAQIARVMNLLATNPDEVSILRVARVKDDRGTLVVDGARNDDLVFGDPCPFCGQVGYVYYRGSDIVAEMQFHNGQKRSDGKWYQHAAAVTGDAITECAWCGVSAAQWEFWGIEETEKRIRQFRRDYSRKHGYRVRIERRE